MNSLVSTFIGALIAIMIMINGTLSNASGKYTSNVIIHVVGFLAIILVLIIRKVKIKFQRGIPIYLYSAGAIGIFTVLFSNISFSRLGVSLTIALGLLGQSISSIIIDHLGLLGMKVVKFEKRKITGLIFIVLGVFVMTFF